MNSTSAATAAALTFVWLGMVLAISFLEAPLKFRAPGVTLRLGLGIGRLVFRALNRVELVLAAGVLVAVVAGSPTTQVVLLTTLTVVLLGLQLALVRPRLNRRSDEVLAGKDDQPRSQEHVYYVILEVAKVFVLIALGIVLLLMV
ncbi:MAG TPA: hypothetical protein VIL00_12440 [Pseudonocardiaceae bacterium]